MIALAAAGLGEGHWLRADQQSGGRGRMGRMWQSPPGNLYASTVVCLPVGDPPPATLALMTVVALAEVVAAYAPSAELMIKWPNDVLIGGAKLAGILLERSGDCVIVGIGANLAHHPAGLDRAVTSLGAHGAVADAARFCEDLAASFARWLDQWRGVGLAPVRKAWLDMAHTLGTALIANLSDGMSHQGLFDGLTDDGALRLRLADGRVHVIHAADVFLL